MHQVTFTNPKHGSQVFAAFAEMREMEEMCDIKIETSVDELPAHKVVLAACCPYFRDVFKDIDEDTHTIPEQHESKVVSAIINYFYTGRFDIEASLLPDVITTAMFFQAQDIVERCEDHVVRQLNVDNCLQFYSQAKEYNMKDLQCIIIRFINWHFLEVTEQESFMELHADEVCHVVSSDVLNTEKEEDVYEALWKWYKHDEEVRKVHCEEVFSKVRFFQLDPQFITERVIPELTKGECVCKDEIKQAITYQCSDKKKRQQLQENLNPRYPSKIIFMFDSKASVIEKYDPITVDCVKEKRMMMDGQENSSDQGLKAAVVVGNELYVISSSKVERFNKLLLSWERVARGVNIREATLCTDVDCFYVIGGRDQGLAVKYFNVLTSVWSSIQDMITSRRSAASVVVGGRVYVMGGYGPDEPLASTHRFSSRSNKWKELVPLNVPRFGFSAIIVRNKIFAIGGRNQERSLNSLEMFDLDSPVDEWVMFEQNMIRPRNEFGAAFFNGQIWCLGGRGENSIERYDFGTKTWELVGKLGEVRYGMSCVMYPLF